MIKRALLIGVILAGAVGAAVYYGVGEPIHKPADNIPTKNIPARAVEVKPDTAAEKTALDNAENDKALDEAEAYGSGTDDTPKTISKTASDITAKKVTPVMKPRATGTFVIEDKAANVMLTTQLDKTFKIARRITDKKMRDQAYLEILDSAVANGNIDIARRISEKLSTPELRKTAREIMNEAAQ